MQPLYSPNYLTSLQTKFDFHFFENKCRDLIWGPLELKASKPATLLIINVLKNMTALKIVYLLRCLLNFLVVALRALSRTTISKGTSFEAEAGLASSELPLKREAPLSNRSS
jgi:hypothetical protein